MSSAKKCKNLAEEDRRQKALKKEKKAVKKWKWTSDFDQESFKREDAAPLQEESYPKEDASLNCGSESSSNKVDEVTSKLVCLALESKSNPALAQRDAVTDDESEEDVLENLLETPFLSSATGEEITIADEEEEEDVKSRQIAQKQSNKVVGDKKDKEKDYDEKDNKEENKNVAKQHLKCTSVAFHGCDDKCFVEDLTPYQNSKRCMGEYFCPQCNSRWQSASSNANRSQRCQECGQDIFPHWQRPLDDWEARAVSRSAHSGHDACFSVLNRGKRSSLKKRRAVSRKTNLKMRVAR